MSEHGYTEAGDRCICGGDLTFYAAIAESTPEGPGCATTRKPFPPCVIVSIRTPAQMQDDGVPPWTIPTSYTGRLLNCWGEPGAFVANALVLRVQEYSDRTATLHTHDGYAAVKPWWPTTTKPTT